MVLEIAFGIFVNPEDVPSSLMHLSCSSYLPPDSFFKRYATSSAVSVIEIFTGAACGVFSARSVPVDLLISDYSECSQKGEHAGL